MFGRGEGRQSEMVISRGFNILPPEPDASAFRLIGSAAGR
jgi:hypothetical protein